MADFCNLLVSQGVVQRGIAGGGNMKWVLGSATVTLGLVFAQTSRPLVTGTQWNGYLFFGLRLGQEQGRAQ